MCRRRMWAQSEWKVQIVGRESEVAMLDAGFASVPRFGEELVDPLEHFARGFVRESHAEDVLRHDASLDEMRDAEGDDTGLARAGAGQNQHGAVEGFNSQALLRIERAQVQHGARSLGVEEGKASGEGGQRCSQRNAFKGNENAGPRYLHEPAWAGSLCSYGFATSSLCAQTFSSKLSRIARSAPARRRESAAA